MKKIFLTLLIFSFPLCGFSQIEVKQTNTFTCTPTPTATPAAGKVELSTADLVPTPTAKGNYWFVMKRTVVNHPHIGKDTIYPDFGEIPFMEIDGDWDSPFQLKADYDYIVIRVCKKEVFDRLINAGFKPSLYNWEIYGK